jgi:hypothetical protein
VWMMALVSGLAAALGSCLPEPIPLTDLEKVTPQIVVSTQIVPEEGLVVLLTKTFGALDANEDSDPQELLAQIAVADAVVVITGPLQADTLLSLGSGLYGGVSIPFQSGDTYRLDVSSRSLGKITATTTVVPQVTFESIEAELYFNGYDDTLAQITHAFADPAAKNWYMLNVQRIERDDLVENLLNPSAFMRLLEDTDFDGQRYEETFRAFPRNFTTGDTVTVSLSNISQDYYRFLDMRIDNRFSFIEYLSEPVNYPSNVVGGKGFFNLYIPDIRVFVME